MMKADRNGFFFVTNRETGKVLSAEKYVPTTWAEKWDVADRPSRRGPGQARGPRTSGQGGLPEPDRRQKLAADVV